jgi:hypothetical protein
MRPGGGGAEFLCYDQPYTYSEAMSFTLLHDVLVRGSLGGSLEMESKLWKAMDLFGRKQAKWMPCWANQDVVSTDSNDAKVSIYSRGEDGLVAIVSNLGKDPREVQASFNLKALGLPETFAAWDILNEREIPIAPDGVIKQNLQPLDFRAIWIKPKAPEK